MKDIKQTLEKEEVIKMAENNAKKNKFIQFSKTYQKIR